MKIDPRAIAKHFAQGLLMGSVDVIPGVSGGTMALIVGIYERLVYAVSQTFSMVIHLLLLKGGEARRSFGEIEWQLILPLLAGIGTAIVSAARLIPWLLETYPMHMRGLFLGLVTASIAVPWRRMRRRTAWLLFVAAVAAVAAYLFVGLPFFEVSQPGLGRVFASAAVAICAMVLPGVSGAFLLEVLGMYRPTLDALRHLDAGYVLVFALGAAVGLGLFSRLLEWLLEHRHDPTMAALVGLMAGSLRALWPWLGAGRQPLLPGTSDPVAGVVAMTLAGFACVALLTWWEHRHSRAATA